MYWRRANSGLPAALLLAAPLLLVALLTDLNFAPQTDEFKFHLGVVQQFGAALPAIPWRDYHAATPPLPYLLWALWGRVLGYGLPALRGLTLLLSFAGFLIFYAVARRQNHAAPLVEALLLLFSPYVFLNSFTLYTVNMGLPFAALALGCYLEAERAGWKALLFGGLAAAAAIYCRQHYLFLPAGVGLVWLAERIRARRLTLVHLRDLALIALPALLFAPLALAWGGLTPPAFQTLHALRPNAENVNFLLMVIGAYGAPLGLFAWPALAGWGWRALGLLAGVPFYALFRPAYGVGGDAQLGIILHGLDILGRQAGAWLAFLAGLAVWANGLAVIVAGLRRAGRSVWLPAAWLLAFAVILLASEAVYERYYAIIMPVLLLWFYPQIAGRRWLLGLWLALSAGLSGTYFALKA